MDPDPELLTDFFGWSITTGSPPRTPEQLQALLDRWLESVEAETPWRMYEARQTADWIAANMHFVQG